MFYEDTRHTEQRQSLESHGGCCRDTLGGGWHFVTQAGNTGLGMCIKLSVACIHHASAGEVKTGQRSSLDPSLTLSVSWSSKKASCWHKPHRRTETPERKPHSYSHLSLITSFFLLFLIILLLLQLIFLLTVSKAYIAGLGIGLVVDCFLSKHKAPGSIPSTAKAGVGEAPQQTVPGKVDIHMQKNGIRFIS